VNANDSLASVDMRINRARLMTIDRVRDRSAIVIATSADRLAAKLRKTDIRRQREDVPASPNDLGGPFIFPPSLSLSLPLLDDGSATSTYALPMRLCSWVSFHDSRSGHLASLALSALDRVGRKKTDP